ncbi:MAG: carbohydrate ABC transporter permease [Chloroflexi bacterium]|nr:carbohydrate ABC transporter permease [Chloroflexota bacterium]
MAASSSVITSSGLRPTGGSVKRHKTINLVLLYAIIILLSVVFMFPFFWTVSSSLKTPEEINTFPPTWFPKVPQFVNYVRVFQKVPFLTWIKNSVIVVILGTSGALISSSIVAYSFARFEYRGRDLIFLITLGTMMLPAQVTLIPQFVLFHKLGWVPSIKPLWVPAWFGGGAFNIFLLRQFMMSLPKDLDEAAVIDGASYPRIFWRIVIPLCKPALATVTVLSFIGRWNDFIGPLIYLNTRETFTLAVGLSYFQNLPEAPGVPLYHLLMAASVLAILPILVLFFSAQRYFVQGIVLSGIKG